jgi:hypothetical protein
MLIPVYSRLTDPSCNYVGNGILSCYPESNTTIVQGNYSKFIWNAQFPTFIVSFSSFNELSKETFELTFLSFLGCWVSSSKDCNITSARGTDQVFLRSFFSDVDIYLYNANTEEIATSWLGVQNARGMIGITPDDEWWPEETASEWFNSNENRTIPYYFIVVDGGSQLTGGETHQSTFTVIREFPSSSLLTLRDAKN